MQNLETVRSAEQLAFDLSKALQFTLTDLRAFRKGILPAASCHVLMGKVLEPLFKSAAVTLLPLFGLSYSTSTSHHCSLSDGLMILVSNVTDLKALAEAQGWFWTVLYLLIGLGLLGAGVYFATRIPMDLMTDIIAKRVRCYDGRVTAREEDTPGSKKGDKLPDYFFETKQCTFPVSRRAYLALDSGGAYRVYYLPLSRTLVAIEPSVLAKEAEEKERTAKERPPVKGAI